jgi:hypothetical protein
MTARTGHPGQDSRDRTDRQESECDGKDRSMGGPWSKEQDIGTRKVETIQPGKTTRESSHERKPSQERDDRTVRT